MKKTDNKKPVIGIIGGNGRFGGWFKSFFTGAGLKVLVAGRKTELTPKELASACDIVIVCVPIPATAAVIREVRDEVRPDALLCDFTSLKELPLAEMMKTKSACGVTGIHPLFGPLVPNMEKQVIVFCSGRDNHWTKFLAELFKANGAQVIYSLPADHDRQMAVAQAFTHFINIVFARTIQKQKFELLNTFSTPVFRLQSVVAGRVLGGSPELYADLEMENPFFAALAEEFLGEAKKIISRLKAKDRQGFAADFAEAAAAMDRFVPVAQAKAVELISLLDRQPVELKKFSGAIKLGNLKGRVAYLGPDGTFSHQAARQVFPRSMEEMPCPAITGIFSAVINDEAILGIVPAENSTEGVIQETMDNLIKHPLRIVGSYKLPVHLNFLARTADVKKIKVIKSHAQPLAQSRNWLYQHFPGAKLEVESSTVQAILSSMDPSVAFIGSQAAAEKYNLQVLFENIEDKKNNITQFYIIAKKDSPELAKKLGADKTLLLLAVYDRPGVLRDILNEFARRNINLTKLHSKATEAEGWDYYFFVELAGLPENKKIQEALKAIKKFCSIVRILGET
ncbi:MAG: prephenate dehydratase [Patescibacteria group bacterium]|nr:prephenate dehydratase [Patescibacteria group bacterium]